MIICKHYFVKKCTHHDQQDFKVRIAEIVPNDGPKIQAQSVLIKGKAQSAVFKIDRVHDNHTLLAHQTEDNLDSMLKIGLLNRAHPNSDLLKRSLLPMLL